MNKYKTIKYFFYIYFTNFPYILYNETMKISNMSMNGVGLGLIYSQQIFWFSNISTVIVTYYCTKLYYFKIFVYCICSYLYVISLLKSIYLYKKLILFYNV